MSPINKTNYERRKCRSNVPPILTLRKKDIFDLLLKENQISNPFLTSTELESSTTSAKSSHNRDESKDGDGTGVENARPSKNRSEILEDIPVKDVSGERNMFFPKSSSSSQNQEGKYVNRFKNIQKRRKRTVHTVRGQHNNSLSLFCLEKCLIPSAVSSKGTDCGVIPLLASTPIKDETRVVNLQRETLSPIARDRSSPSLLLPSPCSQLSDLLTTLSFKDGNIGFSTQSPCKYNKSASFGEEFPGFPTYQIIPKLESQVSRDYDESVCKSSVENKMIPFNISEKEELITEVTNKEEDKVDDQMNSNHVENKITYICDRNECEKIIDLTNVERGACVDNEIHCDEILMCNKSGENDVKKNDIKELVNINERSSQSPPPPPPPPPPHINNEKQNIIIVCGESIMAEDEEDKSEDVSSALSSDQEAREGVSSSDLESNSIDEEKDNCYVEMRRHPFEKISPKKSSYITGPFSRRKCVSKVQQFFLPEGVVNDVNQAQSKDSEIFHKNHSSSKFQHRLTCDSLSEHNQKMSPIFSDPVCDLELEEKSGIGGGRSPPSSPALSYSLYENCTPLDPLLENLDENQDETSQICANESKNKRAEPTSHRRRSNRLSKDLSPSRQTAISRPSVIPDLNMVIEESDNEEDVSSVLNVITELDHFVLPANKKYRRSLSIIRQLSNDEHSVSRHSPGINVHKGRGYSQFLDHIVSLQTKGDPLKTTPIRAYRKSLSIRRLSLLGQRTPPRGRRASRISIQPISTTETRQPHLKRSTNFPISPFPCNRIQAAAAASTIRISSQLHHQSLLKKYSKNQELLKDNSLDENQDEMNSADNRSEGEEAYTPKDHVMNLCGQQNPVPFLDILDESSFEDSMKVGEGVYGEVFIVSRCNRKNVLKIIPIEGSFLVNGEKQKTFAEVYTELLISKWLDLLRDNTNKFMTVCFVELIASWVVKGRYPDKFLELWDEYDERKGSDNDKPNIFNDEQLFLVLELGNAGTDLESYSFSTAKQALSIFKQTVFAIAVAEACFEFEHRDLHWGNVLISRTAERFINFKLDGKEYKVVTNGVKSTIIDYTLSRLTLKEGIPIYNDIGQDPDMFIATGDYQFDIYRHMKKDVGDQWEQYVPKTNVRWLHYLIDKMIRKVKYQRKTAKVHRDSMRCLQDIESWIIDCDNSVTVALRIDDYK